MRNREYRRPGGPGCSLRDEGPCDGLSFLPQKLEAANFDEKKEINKRKQLILEGKVRAERAGGGGGRACRGHRVPLSHLRVLP